MMVFWSRLVRNGALGRITKNVLIFSPFIIVFVVNNYYIGVNYYNVPDDAVFTTFSHATEWMTVPPIPVSHLPAIPTLELSALFVWLLRGVAAPIVAFWQLGLVTHVGFGLMASFLVYTQLSKSQTPISVIVVITAITATMPAMMIYSSLWSTYYMFGLLMMIAATYLLNFFNEQAETREKIRSLQKLFFVLGLSLSSMYLSFIVIISLIFSLFILIVFFRNYRDVILTKTNCPKWWVLLGAVSISAFFVSVLTPLSDAILSRLSLYPGPDKFIILRILQTMGSILLALLIYCHPLLRNPMQNIGSFLFTGGLISTNAGIATWGYGAILSLLNKGGGASPESLLDIYAKTEFIWFFSQSVWNYFLLLAAVTAILALMHGIKSESSSRGYSIFSGSLIVLVLIVSYIVTLDVSFLPRSGHAFSFAQGGRYHLAFIALIPIVIMYWWKTLPSLMPVIVVVSLAISVLTIGQYSSRLSDPVEASTTVQHEVSAVIREFKTAHPNGSIICMTSWPTECRFAEAMAVRRKLDSKQDAPIQLFSSFTVLYCEISPADCRRQPGPTLLIGKGDGEMVGWPQATTAEMIYHRTHPLVPTTGISMYLYR